MLKTLEIEDNLDIRYFKNQYGYAVKDLFLFGDQMSPSSDIYSTKEEMIQSVKEQNYYRLRTRDLEDLYCEIIDMCGELSVDSKLYYGDEFDEWLDHYLSIYVKGVAIDEVDVYHTQVKNELMLTIDNQCD